MSAASRACLPPMSPSALQKHCTLASNTSSQAKLILHSPQQTRKMNGNCCVYIPRCQPLNVICCFPSPTTFNVAWERHGMSQISKHQAYSKLERKNPPWQRMRSSAALYISHTHLCIYPTPTYVHIPCTLIYISHCVICRKFGKGFGRTRQFLAEKTGISVSFMTLIL